MSSKIAYNPMLSLWIDYSRNVGGRLMASNSALFRLRPTVTCSETLKQYGLLARTRLNGIQIFFKSLPLLEPNRQIVSPIDQRIPLPFILTPTNNRVLQHFGPENSNLGKHIYINNLTGDQQIKPAEATIASLKVEDNTTTSRDNIDYMHVRPSSFTALTPASSNDSYDLFIKSVTNSSISSYTIPLQEKINAQQWATTVDILDYRSGRYRMTRSDNNNTLQEMYVDDRLNQKSIFGLVELFWEGRQASTVVGNKTTFRSYKITYEEH